MKSDLRSTRQRFGHDFLLLLAALEREFGSLQRWITYWWAPAVALFAGLAAGVGRGRGSR